MKYPQTITHCMLAADLKTKVELLRGWEISPSRIHTGVDVKVSQVHSVCRGVVVDVGTDLYESGQSVIVQYDVQQCVRYGHLASVKVKLNDIVDTDTLIGVSDRFVHFEYLCSRLPQSNLFPVRVGMLTYYKYDPTSYIVNADVLLPNTNRTQTIVEHDWVNIKMPAISSEMYKELFGGKQDV